MCPDRTGLFVRAGGPVQRHGRHSVVKASENRCADVIPCAKPVCRLYPIYALLRVRVPVAKYANLSGIVWL